MKRWTFSVAALLGLLSCAATAHATLSLSATPYEGGYDLNFGKTDTVATVTKEVVFRITSDENKQYRLTQTLYEPLTNAAGVSIPYQNLAVSSVIGSNRTGTLSVDHETPVSPGPQVLFTSNVQGISENFTLVYALKGPVKVPGGSYRGRIIFSLEAADGSVAPKRVYMTILVQVEGGKGVEIRTQNNSKVLTLNNEIPGEEGSEVFFDVKSSYGTQFRIFQFVEPLRSQDGSELPAGAVQFSVRGAQSGSGPGNAAALPSGESLVYVSSPAGSGEKFTALYALAPGAVVKSGKYQGRIRYYLSSAAVNENLESLMLEVPVQKIFDLEIKTDSGAGTISFPDLKPGTSRQFEIQIRVKNNTGKRYQVNQKVISDLVNKEGQGLPDAQYTLTTRAAKETRGNAKVPAPAKMKVGETTLFVSDSKGSPDAFNVVYELNAPRDSKAGDYSSAVSFTLSEL